VKAGKIAEPEEGQGNEGPPDPTEVWPI